MGHRPAQMSDPTLEQLLRGAAAFVLSEDLQAMAPPGTQVRSTEDHSGMPSGPPFLFPSETRLRVTSPSTAVILKSCRGSGPRILLEVDPLEKSGLALFSEVNGFRTALKCPPLQTG